jgi:hypothetical protein
MMDLGLLRALTQNGEIMHTWTDPNVVDWDVEEVFQDFVQNDRYVDLYS